MTQQRYWKSLEEKNEDPAFLKQQKDEFPDELPGLKSIAEPIPDAPGAPPPPFFKRWAVSFLAVYPPLVFLVWAFQPITSRIHWVLGLFLVAGVLTCATTAFLIPWLTRRLQPWLVRR